MAMIRAAFFGDADMIDRVYAPVHRARIAAHALLYPEVIPGNLTPKSMDALAEADVLFSTWGMPLLTDRYLELLPRLRAVFYAAGSVQPFAAPLLEREIAVISAWRANAIPVAEFSLAQILLACKGYFRNVREYRERPAEYESIYRGPGCYGETVALLGLGAVGSRLLEMLRPFSVRVIVYDPFLDEARARALQIESVSLAEAFSRAIVVSNHIADKRETAGLLGKPLFSRLRDGATFINTGRGRTVIEPELAVVMSDRPDLTALLDVTDPEPIRSDSPLIGLPNVRITTHLAGSVNDELTRLADYCVLEFEQYARGEPFRHAVTPEMLLWMA